MCKEFENEELELNEQESVNLEDLDKDELINIIYSLSEQKDKEIEIYTDNVQDTKIDSKEFENGVKSVSFVAGAFSALNSVGYPKDLIHEFLINRETIDYQLSLNEQTCESNERQAKITQVKLEQNQI